MKLLRSQKNKLYDYIENMGFTADMFIYKDPYTSNQDTTIEYKDFEFKFHIMDGPQNDFFVMYTPGEEKMQEEQYPGTWEYTLTYFNDWLRNISRETREPDKWNFIEEAIKNVHFQDIQYDNTKFTHEEYKVLEANIKDLKAKFSKFELLEEQVKIIDDKLDHLLELAKEMKKTDWKDIFIGAFISLIFQLTVDRTTGQLIFSSAMSLIKGFFPQLKS